MVGSTPRRSSSFALNEFKISLSNLTARRTQIDYLTEDLTMDANHTLKTFFRLVQAHSEAQPYYPELQMDQEVGSVFSDSRRIQIVWNASNALFHNELVNLNITRMDDFNGDYETCKTKLLLAERPQTKTLKTSPAKEKMTMVAKVPNPKRIPVSLAAMAAKSNVATAVALIGKPTASKILTDPITGPANQPRGPQTPNSTLRILATAIRSAEEAR